MKLSDIMSHANLAGYAEVAMVLFLLVFLAVTVRLWLPGRQAEYAAAAQLPFDDDTAAAPQEPAAHG